MALDMLCHEMHEAWQLGDATERLGERKQKWEGGVAGLCGLSRPVGIPSSIFRSVYTLCLFGVSASFQVCLCVGRLSCFNALTQGHHAW